MASLLETKKKIGSIKNMKKITKAMQLVAASKMKHFQHMAQNSRSYIYELLRILDLYLDSSEHSVYTEQRTEGDTLFILYASDKGLCGSLNNQLTKALLNAPQWKDLPQDQRQLITIGKKAFDYAKSNSITPRLSFSGIKEKAGILDLLPIVGEIMDLWKAGTVKKIYIITPHYKNSFTFYPQVKELLPFSREMVKSYVIDHAEAKPRPTRNIAELSFKEPSPDRVLRMLMRQVIIGAFVQSLYELKASEYSSRMIAMKNATDAADKIIDEKTIEYNKIRQQIITQQIAEISVAADAIS